MPKKIIQTLILLVLLVGFPLVSWIYLSGGLNFRLNAIEALQPKASLPFEIDSLHIKGNILIWYDHSNKSANNMQSVKAHFADREDVIFSDFPLLLHSDLKDSLTKVMEFTSRGDELQSFAFLVGQLGQIRGNYLLDSEDQLGDLTEHIAFLVPPDSERDFEFRREVEK